METSQSIKDTLFSICSLFFKGLFGNSTRRIQFNIRSPSGWEEDSRYWLSGPDKVCDKAQFANIMTKVQPQPR